MKLKALALSALALLVGCEDDSGVNTFITREDATVVFTTLDQPFAVKFRAGFGAPEYWCSAGRFAERFVPGPTRIFRLTPAPRPRGQDMVFTLVQPPPGAAQPTGLARFGDSSSLSVFAATDLCTSISLRGRSF